MPQPRAIIALSFASVAAVLGNFWSGKWSPMKTTVTAASSKDSSVGQS